MDLVWNSFIDGRGEGGGGGKNGSRKAKGKGRKQKEDRGRTNGATDANIVGEGMGEGNERRRKILTDDDYERREVKEERAGIKLKNYFRNPQGMWQERNLTLGVATDSVVVPIGQYF